MEKEIIEHDEFEIVNNFEDEVEIVNEFEDEENDDDDVDEEDFPDKPFSEFLIKFDNEVDKKRLIAFFKTYGIAYQPFFPNEDFIQLED